MKEIAPGLWQLDSRPANAFNSYVMGGVLVDAGTRWAQRRILRQLAGRDVHAHALTHAHADHQGASAAICRALGIPLWASAGEVEAVETGNLWLTTRPHPRTRVFGRLWRGPGHPVARPLREGDEVGGFVVVETPGHSPGHLSFWREADRVLVAGDVLFNLRLSVRGPTLREAPPTLCWDVEQNRRSIAKVAALEPELVCFGHGAPLRDPGQIQALAARLDAAMPAAVV